MTHDPCKRIWEVEALVDGRLADKDRDSLDRHFATCAECKRARERLAVLKDALEALPVAEPSELARRRQRAALVSRANERIVGADRSRRWTLLVLVPIAAAFALLVLRHRPAPSPAAPPAFEVADVDHADFSSDRVGTLSRVALRGGTASFHVEHVVPGARFVVTLPDGEVEVKGTRFAVTVAGGRTRAVVVTEGFVDVRVAGFVGLLHAGERWPTETAPSAAIPVSSAPSIASAPSVSASPSNAASAPITAGPSFAVAMKAYRSGDYGAAERLFDAFVRDFPKDSRVEDAMFLVADARSHRGDASGAKAAARAYLARFPEGLRAPAARRLAGIEAPEAGP
jgi:hypothetical protein